MYELFRWRTRRESAGMDTRVIVCSDVGIVAMRTFIEMTANSKNKAYHCFVKRLCYRESLYQKHETCVRSTTTSILVAYAERVS